MDQSYWLGRRRASAANAFRATSSEARLVHLDLAGRYSVMAVAAEARDAEGKGESARYLRLETGARWLAERAPSAEERREHLGHADRYRHLRLDCAGEDR